MSFECQQCGRCCWEVGRTYWKNGGFSNIPALQKRKSDGDHEDGGLPCEMLSKDTTSGKYVCGIESIYGRQAKPEVCRDYPEDGELCFRQQAETGVELSEVKDG